MIDTCWQHFTPAVQCGCGKNLFTAPNERWKPSRTLSSSANIFTSPPVHFVCLKIQSVRNHCKYGFHAYLDRLESRRVLNFIRENPAQLMWRNSDSRSGSRSSRAPLPPLHQIWGQGERTRSVGSAQRRILIRRESKDLWRHPGRQSGPGRGGFRVSSRGWNSNRIKFTAYTFLKINMPKKLLKLRCRLGGFFVNPSASRVEKQLVTFIVLIRQLMLHDCYDGAVEIAGQIKSFISWFIRALRSNWRRFERSHTLNCSSTWRRTTGRPAKMPSGSPAGWFLSSATRSSIADWSSIWRRRPFFTRPSSSSALCSESSWWPWPATATLLDRLDAKKWPWSSSSASWNLASRPCLTCWCSRWRTLCKWSRPFCMSSPEMWNLISTRSRLDKTLFVAALSSFVRARIASLAVLVEQKPNPSESVSESLMSSKDQSTFNTEWQKHMAKMDKYKKRSRRSIASWFRHVIRLAVMSGLKDSGGSSCSSLFSRKWSASGNATWWWISSEWTRPNGRPPRTSWPTSANRFICRIRSTRTRWSGSSMFSFLHQAEAEQTFLQSIVEEFLNRKPRVPSSSGPSCPAPANGSTRPSDLVGTP